MSIVLQGSTSGSVTLQEPAVAGTTVLNLPATSGTVALTSQISSAGVVQVKATNLSAITASTTSQSFQDITGFSVSITPTSASNKVLILATFNLGSTSTGGGNTYVRLVRDSTAINIGDANGSNARASWYARCSNANDVFTGSITFLDSPATTSATTYKLQWYRNDGTVYLNRPGTFAGPAESEGATTASAITVMEVTP